MSVFETDTLRQAIGGQWVQRPPATGLAFASGVGIDSRENLSGRAFFAITGEAHDGHDFVASAAEGGAAVIVIERDIALETLPAHVGVIRVDSTRSALARLARAHRRTFTTTKVIAVTGSSGKTTTKRLIHSILAQAMTGTCAVRSFNNDIGVPLTLLAAKSSDRYAVVEIGTNAPGEIASLAAIAEPDIAVITNVGRAHLEGLGTVEDVAREKASILSHLREGGTAIINADCPLLREYLKVATNIVLFGESESAFLRLSDRGRSWIEINGRQRFSIGLPGRHNALNALAAIAVARRLGVSDEHIEAGLRAAEPEPMRMAIERIGGVTLVNDAYNANPNSVVASLRAFGEIAADASRRVIVLGDMLELGPDAPDLHREIGGELRLLHRQYPLAVVVLVGELVQHIASEIAEEFARDDVIHLPELNDAAIDDVLSRFAAGDVILLKGSRRIGLERIADRLRASTDDSPRSKTHRDAAVF